jgi:hypothetical protein
MTAPLTLVELASPTTDRHTQLLRLAAECARIHHDEQVADALVRAADDHVLEGGCPAADHGGCGYVPMAHKALAAPS